MTNDVRIIIIVVLATMVTKFLLLMIGRKEQEDNLVLVFWILLFSVSILFQNIFLTLLVMIFIKLFFLKNDVRKNLFAFFALWAAIPASLVVDFPAQSLPLFDANYPRLMLLVWLVPLLPKVIEEARLSNRNIFFDIPFLIVVAMAIKLEFSPRYEFSLTLITSIKGVITLALDFIIPYLIIVAWTKTWSRFKVIAMGLFIGGLMLAVLGTVEAVKNWSFYNNVYFAGADLFEQYVSVRTFVRAKASFPEQLTFSVFGILIFGLALIILLRQKDRFLFRMAVLAVPMIMIFITQSRGGLIGMAVLPVLFLFFRMRTYSKIFYLVMLMVTVPAVGLLQSEKFATGVNVDVDNIDEYGTFEYRKRLFFAQMEILPRHPWFGNSMYKAEPEMQKLIQGQGIIDPVNTFSTIAVEQGVITLSFFLFVILRGVWTGFGYIRYGFAVGNQVWINFGAALSAVIISISVVLATTSFYATVVVVFWFLMGLARAMQLNLKKRMEIREQKESEAWELV